MRSTLKRTLFVSVLLWVGAGVGCAGQEPQPVETAEHEGPSDEAHQLEQLDQQNEHLAARVRELESSLHLARAEVRDMQELEAERSDDSPRQVVRLGHHEATPVWSGDTSDGEWIESSDELDEGAAPAAAASANDSAWEVPLDDGRPRPVLRLYGSPAASLATLDTSTPLLLPPAPPGMPTSLPLAAIPEPSAALMATRGAHSRMPPRARRADAAAVTAYQRALSQVRDRQFSEALSSFDTFLNSYPRHPYAASAVYWQGEVYYAMRNYGLAATRFSRVVSEYPRASKVADSLFKLGMCHKRMGQSRAARRYFERVRHQYPESVAARLSVQEDA